MKLKQVLEKIRWSSVVERDGEWVSDAGIDYLVNGRKVTEVYFKKQEKRICLWSKQTNENSEGPVFCGPGGPGCLDKKITKIVQYIPLFYRK